MDRNYLKGQDGDRINAALTGRWFQLPPLLRWFAALLRAGDEPHQQRRLSVSRRVDLAEAPVEEPQSISLPAATRFWNLSKLCKSCWLNHQNISHCIFVIAKLSAATPKVGLAED